MSFNFPYCTSLRKYYGTQKDQENSRIKADRISHQSHQSINNFPCLKTALAYFCMYFYIKGKEAKLQNRSSKT